MAHGEYDFPKIRWSRDSGRIQARRPMETTLNSFYLGGQHAISSGGENVFFKNVSTGVDYYPMWGGILDQEVLGNRGADGVIVPSGRWYGDALISQNFFQLPHATAVTPYYVNYDPATESVHNVEVVLGEVLYVGDHVIYHIHNDNHHGPIVYSQDVEIETQMEIGETFSMWFEHPHEQKEGQHKLAMFKVKRGHTETPMLVAATVDTSDFFILNPEHELHDNTQVASTYRDGTDGDMVSAMSGPLILNTDATQPLAIAENLIGEEGTILIEYTPSRLYDHNTIFDNTEAADTWESWIYGSGQLAFRVTGSNALFTTNLLVDTTYTIGYKWSVTDGTVTYQVGVDGVWGVAQTGTWAGAPTGGIFLGGANGLNTEGEGKYDRVYKFDKALSDSEFLAVGSSPQDLLIDNEDALIPYVLIRYRTFEDKDLASVEYVDAEVDAIVTGSGYATTDYVDDAGTIINTAWATADTAGDAASVTSSNNYTNTQLNSYSNTTQMNTAIANAVTNSHTDRIMSGLPTPSSTRVTLVGGWTYNLTGHVNLGDKYVQFSGSGKVVINGNGYSIYTVRPYSLVYTDSTDSGIKAEWNNVKLSNTQGGGVAIYTDTGAHTCHTFNDCHILGSGSAVHARGYFELIFNNCIIEKNNVGSSNTMYFDPLNTGNNSTVSMVGCSILVNIVGSIPEATAIYSQKGRYKSFSMIGCTVEFPYVYGEESSSYQYALKFDDFYDSFSFGRECIISGLVIKQSNLILKSNVMIVGKEGARGWTGLSARDISVFVQHFKYNTFWKGEALNHQSLDIIKVPIVAGASYSTQV